MGFTSPRERVLTSLHERLHHELQNTTLWGLITRFADDYRRAGIWQPVANALFWIGVLRAQLVHETYATTLAVGFDDDYAAVLDGNPEYKAHYARGVGLLDATTETWPVDRFIIDAALRGCMTATELTDVAGAMPYARIADFDAPGVRPDARLLELQRIDLRPLRDQVAEPPRTMAELRAVHDAVAGYLSRHGLRTLSSGEYRDAIIALTSVAQRLLPDTTIEFVEERADPVQDDLEELQRERIELHAAPLPVELVGLDEVGQRPIDFLRDHHEVGTHVLAVWARADLLARQFSVPNPLEGRHGEHLLVVQTAGNNDAGTPVVRLAVIEGLDDISVLARLWSNIRVLYLTTTASIDDAPPQASFTGEQTLFVLADQPVFEQLRHTLGRDATVRWERAPVSGDRTLTVFVYEVDALPGTVYLHLATEVGAYALSYWLTRGDGGRAQRSPELLATHHGEIDAITQHIVSAWWRLDQLGARRA